MSNKSLDTPAILVVDLETSPIQAYTWGPKWETNILEFIEHSKILSYSAKWLNGHQITKGLPDYKGYKKGELDDRAIVKDLWNLLDEADLVIGQNSKAFDEKIMNARFLFHGLTPPSPYKSVDTRNEARRYLRLPSYKLDDMCDYFGIGRKLEHEGFPLWLKCMAGDKKAWRKMLRYNKADTLLTEKLYLQIRPWVKVNTGIFYGKTVCSRCGGRKLQRRGLQKNITTTYIRLHCQSCGGWQRLPQGEMLNIKPTVSL